jgi:predicted nucleic acid-binding protein
MPHDVVIDASLASKWVLPERDSGAALAILRQEDIVFHAPELCVAELVNILWKRVKRGELSPREAIDTLELVRALPVRHHPHEPLADSALAIAIEFDITAYDALYVAVARGLGAEVITADGRLARAGASDPQWPVRML